MNFGQKPNQPTSTPFGSTPSGSAFPFASTPFGGQQATTNTMSGPSFPFATPNISAHSGQTQGAGGAMSPFGQMMAPSFGSSTSQPGSSFGVTSGAGGMSTAIQPYTQPTQLGGGAGFGMGALGASTGTQPSTTAPQTRQSMLFGTSTQPVTSAFGSSGVFGQSATTQPSTGLFGSTTATQSTFGSSSPFANRPTGTSTFSTGPMGFGTTGPSTAAGVGVARSSLGTSLTGGASTGGWAGSFGATSEVSKGSLSPAFLPTELQEKLERVRIQHICAMPAYSGKQTEEIRMEDYNQGRRPIFPGVPSTGLFGNAPITQPGTSIPGVMSSGLPGLTQPTTTPAFSSFGSTTGMFGKPAETAATQFPTQISSVPQPSTSSAFGGATTGTSAFGSSWPSTLGSSATRPAALPTSVFGTTLQPTTPFGSTPFGTAPSNLQASAGSAISSVPSIAAPTFTFQQPAKPFGSFGEVTETAPLTTGTNFQFGGSALPASSGIFGSNTPAITTPSNISTLCQCGRQVQVPSVTSGYPGVWIGGSFQPSLDAENPFGPNIGSLIGQSQQQEMAESVTRLPVSQRARDGLDGSSFTTSVPRASMRSPRSNLRIARSSAMDVGVSKLPDDYESVRSLGKTMPVRFPSVSSAVVRSNKLPSSFCDGKTSAGGTSTPLRSRERSTHGEATLKDLTAQETIPSSFQQITTKPTRANLHEDYYLQPTFEQLKQQALKTKGVISNFTVGHFEYGSVTFTEDVKFNDIPWGSICSVVELTDREVSLHTDDEIGSHIDGAEALNVDCIVRLHSCVPSANTSKDLHIARLKNVEGTDFVDFLDDKSTWVFKIHGR